MFAQRVFGGLALLRSAVELERPALADLRAWMSTRFVAEQSDMPVARLAQALQVDEAALDIPLRQVAEARGIDRLALLRQVQAALAANSRSPPAVNVDADSLDNVDDWLIGWIIAYGYPVLVLSLVFGAMGAPLPSGLSLMVMGALAAQGRLDPWLAGVVATTASVLGDFFGYLIGARIGEPAIRRHGHWIGLNPERWTQARRALARWGPAAIVLSRSLVSFLSSAVNLLAGALRQSLVVFIPAAIIGRALWSAGYLLIGLLASSGLSVGAGFMRDLSGLVISLLVAMFVGRFLYRERFASAE
ncbi:MAG: DedA family protein [Burkholderiaceae bacterium]